MIVEILHIQRKYIHIPERNDIIYGDNLSSVSKSKSVNTYEQQSQFKFGDYSSTSTESNEFLNKQKKRNHNKQSNASLDGTVPIICFNDKSIPYGTNILFPIVKFTTTSLYRTKYDTTSASSESEFSLERLKKRRAYSSKKRSANTSNNNRANNKNHNYKKLGKTNNVVLDNSRNSTVRKYPIRKRNTTVNQTLTDPLIDTDTSFESYDSFANEHSSSSEWKLTSGSDNSTFTITKSHTSPVLKKDTKIKNGKSNEYSTLNKKYPAQIYNYISNRNKIIQKRGKIKISSIAVGTKKLT